MDLFEHQAERERERNAPLADRMRPRRLDEVEGQPSVVGPESFLARALAADRLPSLLLWGPPGSGKTTLARLTASYTKAVFVPFSAVLGGVKEVRAIIEEARRRRVEMGRRTILFVDEIHRFNKAQQDAFLPHVEDGTVILIGATTENPSFYVNSALLSRCRVVRLESLDGPALVRVLRRALADPERGLAGKAPRVADDALERIAAIADGDARRALNLLEQAIAFVRAGGSGPDARGKDTGGEDAGGEDAGGDTGEEGTADDRDEAVVDAAALEEALARQGGRYDKTGDQHYDLVSAFIKSLRGSDPDAALYWMLRMLDAGEDPLFIIRRMVIFAAEDIGNADPRALQVAVAVLEAFRFIGLPEGKIPMAQACTYLASSVKSNAAYLALHAAEADVREHGSLPVPVELRNAPTALMKSLGYGHGYRYPHDFPGHFVPGATYLPEALTSRTYYQPSDQGLEGRLGERLRNLRRLRDGETEGG